MFSGDLIILKIKCMSCIIFPLRSNVCQFLVNKEEKNYGVLLDRKYMCIFINYSVLVI